MHIVLNELISKKPNVSSYQKEKKKERSLMCQKSHCVKGLNKLADIKIKNSLHITIYMFFLPLNTCIASGCVKYSMEIFLTQIYTSLLFIFLYDNIETVCCWLFDTL